MCTYHQVYCVHATLAPGTFWWLGGTQKVGGCHSMWKGSQGFNSTHFGTFLWVNKSSQKLAVDDTLAKILATFVIKGLI